MSKLSEQMRERSRVIDVHVCCTTGGCVKCLLEFGGLRLAEAETRLDALVEELRGLGNEWRQRKIPGPARKVAPLQQAFDRAIAVVNGAAVRCGNDLEALLVAHGFGDEDQAALRGQDEPEGR